MSNEDENEQDQKQGEVKFEQKKLNKDEEEALKKAMEEAIKGGIFS